MSSIPIFYLGQITIFRRLEERVGTLTVRTPSTLETTSSWNWPVKTGLDQNLTQVLCISTSKRVLCMPFAGRNQFNDLNWWFDNIVLLLKCLVKHKSYLLILVVSIGVFLIFFHAFSYTVCLVSIYSQKILCLGKNGTLSIYNKSKT